MKAITIRWLTPEAIGYVDVLPFDQFATEVARAESLHEVLGPRGGIHHARFRLRVKGKSALLDY